jgi:release factor glutamine methyltransferase
MERAAFLRSDWFAGGGRFDLIVSNPPYIAAADSPGCPRGAPRPRDRPDPGGDGLDAYRAIAARGGAHLTPGGRLVVEIGHEQGAAVAALFREAGLADVAVHPDINGKDRVVAGCRA